MHVLLNNISHKNLRINTKRSAEFGDDVMCAIIYPIEFVAAHEQYPIVFHQNIETGHYTPVALLGLEENENLFLRDNAWENAYIPMIMQRDPFLIGQQTKSDGQTELVIHVDVDSPRVSSTDGEPVFLPQGGNTDYIENVARVLKTIHESQAVCNRFTATLSELKLFEPLTLEMDLGNQRQHRISGFHTISESVLAQLNKDAVFTLHQQGLFPLIYSAILSLANVKRLISLKQKLESMR